MNDVWKWIAVSSVSLVLGGGGAGIINSRQSARVKEELAMQIDKESSSRDAMIATLSSQIGGIKDDLRTTREEVVRLGTIIEERIPPRR